MTFLPTLGLWRAEGLRLRRQPLAWAVLGALFVVLLVAAASAGLDARAWRASQDAHDATLDRHLRSAALPAASGPPAAIATYQLGRGELGATHMALSDGLALGVHRLEVLPARLKATLDSRHVDARSPGVLHNPLLADTGLPGLPAMVALLLPLAAIVLCAGLLQEERERGRLQLIRVQSRRGVPPVLVAALGWRFVALAAVAVVGTLPALLMDPGAGAGVAARWSAALLAFCGFWVLLGAALSCMRISCATALVAGCATWLLLTFGVPAGLAWGAQRVSPMPSRLVSVVQIRDAQRHGEDHEAELARDWYQRHPRVPASLPATWPASFLPRVLEQERSLRPMARRFDDSRIQQAAFVHRWSWTSPGLALVLMGEGLAGTDTASHVRYLRSVDDFEDRWRAFLVPHVMSRRGLPPEERARLPRYRPLPAE